MSNAVSQFSLDDAGRRVEGRWAVYPNSLLFRAGDYPDKDFTLTPGELAQAASSFEPVFGNLLHTDYLKGRACFVRRAWADDGGDTLRAEVAVPLGLDELLHDGERKLSCEWDRKTKTLSGVAMVLTPRVTGAALMSADTIDAAFEPDAAVFGDEKPEGGGGKGHFITVDGHAVYIGDKPVDKGHIKAAAVKHGLSAESHSALVKAHDEGKVQTDEHLYKTIGAAKRAMKGDDEGKGGKPEAEAVADALNKHAKGEPIAQTAYKPITPSATPPSLSGTPKQVSWAQGIRDGMLSAFRAHHDAMQQQHGAKATPEQIKAVSKYAQKMHDVLAQKTDSRFFIDNRDTPIADLYRPVVANARAEVAPPMTEPPAFPEGMTRADWSTDHQSNHDEADYLTAPALHALHDEYARIARQKQADYESEVKYRPSYTDRPTRTEKSKEFAAHSALRMQRYLAARHALATKRAPANFSAISHTPPARPAKGHDPMPFMDKLKALFSSAGVTDEELNSLTDADLPAPVAQFSDAEKAQFAADRADFQAAKAELARLRAKDTARDAEQFVARLIETGQAYPTERAGLIAQFSQAAADDAALTATVKFSAIGSDGKEMEATGSRVDALKATLSLRPSHGLTAELSQSGRQLTEADYKAVFSRDNARETADERAARINREADAELVARGLAPKFSKNGK